MRIQLYTDKKIFIVLLTLIIVGCASSESRYDQSVDASGKPGWVSHGTQTSKTPVGRTFLGVGVAQIKGEFAREATVANMRAKEEIERMLSRFIEVASRDYIASGSAKKPSGYIEELEASKSINEMTNLVLSNAQIKGHWVDSRHDKIFAIAEIDYPKVVSLLSTSGNVHSGFKDYLKDKGESVFDRIAIKQ